MSYEVRANPVFDADKRDVLKHFPAATRDLDRALESLRKDPRRGDFYTGTFPELYKLRWPLKSYNIGARGGLRIVYAVKESARIVIPITVWQKKTFQQERDAAAHTKARFQATIEALKTAK